MIHGSSLIKLSVVKFSAQDNEGLHWTSFLPLEFFAISKAPGG